MNYVLKSLLCCAILFCLSCTDDEIRNESQLLSLSENEFFVANDGDSVFIVIHDCKYNQLKSVEKDGMNLVVSKTFNSMMKLPCVLRYDTISLGVLETGEYQLDYFLIDRNTFVEDSVFLHESRILTVK